MKMKKMRPVETVLRMGEREIKENGGRGKFKMYCKYFCNVTMYPSTTII
jgi:hypothetical protein